MNQAAGVELASYADFIGRKALTAQMRGLESLPALHPKLFPHQRDVTEFSLRAGSAAAFVDTGLGKTLIELEFARTCAETTGKPSLILTPLAVAGQMRREANAFGIEAAVIRSMADVTGNPVTICNYERLDSLTPKEFGAVVLDESSILKGFSGKTRWALTRAFEGHRFRLAATATPAPNDHTELGTHAHFLGVMETQEMFARWFVHDSGKTQDWRLKGHAVESFWSWIASWARCVSMPSDLGYSDEGFVLPPLEYISHNVDVDLMQGREEGQLFRFPGASATEVHKERRLTSAARIAKMVDLINASHSACFSTGSLVKLAACGNPSTPKNEDSDTTPTKQSEKGVSSKLGRQTKTRSICDPITSKIEKSLPNTSKREERNVIASVENDTPLTNNLDSNVVSIRDAETHIKSEMGDLSQCSELDLLSTNLCSKSRVENAQSVKLNLETESETGSLSIIATTANESEGSFVQSAISGSVNSKIAHPSSGKPSTTSSLEPWVIWCSLNEEQAALEKIFKDRCFSVYGSLEVDEKESRVLRWLSGERPILLTKPEICGFGLNMQHCRKMAFLSLSYSYEQFYQSVRRIWRFGQKSSCEIHLILSPAEQHAWSIVLRKSAQHEEMKSEMRLAMKRAQNPQQKRRLHYHANHQAQRPAFL